MIRLYNMLAFLCGKLAERLEEAQRHLARCEDCGGSRFYGPPCVAHTSNTGSKANDLGRQGR